MPAGDVQTGPFIAIAAVAAGREAAISIDRFLNGQDLKEGRQFPLRPIPKEQGHWNPIPEKAQKRPRAVMPSQPVEEWIKSFNEINLGLSEAEAVAEADRCLNCGICSECLQCVAACQAGAIDHNQKPETKEIEVGAVILSPGFQTFDPSKYKSYHYANYPNVVTSLEFERILSRLGAFPGPSGAALGPQGAARRSPGSSASAPGTSSTTPTVRRSAACTPSKRRSLPRSTARNALDAAIFFMDMRTFGKEFEQYYNRAQEQGVRFIRSRIHTIDPAPGDNLTDQLHR